MPAKRTSPKSKSKRVFGQSRKPAKMLRAGLYARDCTLDQQTLPLQMRALREEHRKAWLDRGRRV
jgi:hypothetical protein